MMVEASCPLKMDMVKVGCYSRDYDDMHNPPYDNTKELLSILGMTHIC